MGTEEPKLIEEEVEEEPEILSASQQSSVEIVHPEDIELIKEEMKQFSDDQVENDVSEVENVVPEVENAVPEVVEDIKEDSIKADSVEAESEKADSDHEEIFYASSNITPDPSTPEDLSPAKPEAEE